MQTLTEVSFTSSGEPVPKGRPRVVGRRTYTPLATVQAETVLGWAARKAMGGQPPLTGPLAVDLAFSTTRAALRGDLDNLAKLVLDAMNKIVYVDDRQVKQLVIDVYEGRAQSLTSVRVRPR